MELNDRPARLFESIAQTVIQAKYVFFFGMILFAVIMALQLKSFTVDTSTEGLLHETNPVRVAYDEFREQFGRDELIIAAIGPVDIFSESFLNSLRAFHNDLKTTVPHIDDITSLINARNTRGEGQTLYVEDFLENWPESNESLSDLAIRAGNNPVYINTLMNMEGSYATVLIKTVAFRETEPSEQALDDFSEMTAEISENQSLPASNHAFNDRENQETVDAVRTIVDRYNSPEFPIHLSGSPVISAVLKKWMLKDMRSFTLLAFIAITCLTYAVFRRKLAVVICLATIGFTFICTFGLMALFRVPIKIPTILLPSFLLAVSVCSGVHILSLFYGNISRGDDKHTAIIKSLGHCGLAVILAGVTTAGGLLSFISAKVAPIESLGIFAAAGVLISLFYSILWIPSVLALLPQPKIKESGHNNKSIVDTLLISAGDFAVRRCYWVLGCVLIVIIVVSSGIPRLQFTHRSLSWLPENSDERQSTQLIDTVLKGTLAVEVVVDTRTENGLHNPETLSAIERFADTYAAYRDKNVFVGKALAITDILKETNRALNENNEVFYKLPETRDLVAQEFLLFEMSGSDDLEDYMDSRYQKTRISLKVPWKDSEAFKEFIRSVHTYAEEHFSTFTISLTGLPMLMCHTMNAIIDSMRSSYTIAIIAITFLMIIFIGDLRLGLISMIPNLIPIVLTLGIMGWMNIRLDAFTMTLGAIAIGLAVDDTIHFMNNFKRYHAAGYSVNDAVSNTLRTSGKAMLFTSIILSSGFLIYCFSFLNNLNNFGIYTALTILFAFLADCLIAPALIASLMSHRQGKKSQENHLEEPSQQDYAESA